MAAEAGHAPGRSYFAQDGTFHLNDTALGVDSAESTTAYPTMVAEVTFTETSGAGTYTGSVTIPANGTILDIQINGIALWNASGACTMKVGDTDDDGWYTGIDLKATDLLAGEVIRFESAGGKVGVYLVAATGLRSAIYSASARLVTGIITAAGTAGTTGRTRMLVLYTVPTAVAATKV